MLVGILLALQFLGMSKAKACSVKDDHCTFYLTVNSRLTMWRGYEERAYINDDESVSIFNRNGTIHPDEIILADGYYKPHILTVVNGTMPGPTLVVYENQKVTVMVTNKLANEVVSIHWHGLKQRGTPWMDGTGFITQCPILPGQTFNYTFIADTKGTHFYHSHMGGKIATGLFGALIVKERITDKYPEHIIMIQDYNHEYTAEDFRFRALHGDVDPNGKPVHGYSTIDGVQTTLFELTSFLINGRGRVYDDDGINITNTPFSVFEVEPNTTYRFRLINAASFYESRLSIDDHQMSVIAMDGQGIESVNNIDSIVSHSGERVDFLLDTNRSPGNYWIRLNTKMDSSKRLKTYAILRYKGAPITNPSSIAKECTSVRKCAWLNCAVDNFPEADCFNIDEMVSADHDIVAPDASSGPLKEFFIHAGYGVLGQFVTANINGVTFQLPTVSALTQPTKVNNKCTIKKHGCGIEKTCECLNSIDVDFGDVVQLNILAHGFYPFYISHPIHLHGYHFHVMKVGRRPTTNGSLSYIGHNTDIDCQIGDKRPEYSVCNNPTWANSSWLGGNIPGLNAQTRLKDTITVPVGGYVVIRFVADNPGLWHLHCHIIGHSTLMGMGILINDSFPYVPAPPKGFPRCGDFLAPEDESLEQTEEQKQCTGKGHRMTANGKIWAFLGIFSIFGSFQIQLL